MPAKPSLPFTISDISPREDIPAPQNLRDTHSRHPARGASAEASDEAREDTASAGWAYAGSSGRENLGSERVRLLSPKQLGF